MVRHLVFIFLPILLASPSYAELFLDTNFKCVSSIERREIHIYLNSDEPPAGLACKMDYLKGEDVQTLWTASQDPFFCIAKAKELAERLEKTGFKCIATAESAREPTL